ncbi:hypothetical protein CTAYLR_006468 [Chrysophaeum taylorii]|uniref:Sulfotransferase n=1 Tax=Chrysophaeum taylorii TaxID=2483200 RepID=A0AAD7ULG6_9STRA|nr:hypothetical protein CTAYLR_006468 [Chrysophaeum taylorii]
MDAEAPARRAGVEAAARDLVAAAGDRVVFALNTLGGLNDAAMATLRATGTEPPWTQGEGMLSYPNWWSSPNKAVQMPSLLAMSDSLFAARGPATPQLRVVLTTRSATAIVASVCEKRNFGREVGGCATEVSMLVLGAAALTAQISALPPPPAAVCQHFEFEHLQGGDAATLDRLARFLRLDDDNLANLARRVNSKAHSTPSSAGRKLGAAWRAALASDLSRGQETLIRTCVNHGGERRGSTSR